MPSFYLLRVCVKKTKLIEASFFCAWRVNRKLCYGLMPFYVLLCCATVYIQAHYLIDVFAGWVSAVGIYIFSTWMYKKWFASRDFSLVLNR